MNLNSALNPPDRLADELGRKMTLNSRDKLGVQKRKTIGKKERKPMHKNRRAMKICATSQVTRPSALNQEF